MEKAVIRITSPCTRLISSSCRPNSEAFLRGDSRKMAGVDGSASNTNEHTGSIASWSKMTCTGKERGQPQHNGHQIANVGIGGCAFPI